MLTYLFASDLPPNKSPEPTATHFSCDVGDFRG